VTPATSPTNVFWFKPRSSLKVWQVLLEIYLPSTVCWNICQWLLTDLRKLLLASTSWRVDLFETYFPSHDPLSLPFPSPFFSLSHDINILSVYLPPFSLSLLSQYCCPWKRRSFSDLSFQRRSAPPTTVREETSIATLSVVTFEDEAMRWIRRSRRRRG